MSFNPTITLTSPNGNVFDALWKGNTFTKEKALGRYKPPKIDGEKVQDMGVSSETMPLTIFFAESSNVRDGQKFYEACSENGRWTINHPEDGIIENQQLVSVNRTVSIDEDGYRRFDLQFITSLDDIFLLITQAADAIARATSAILGGESVSAFIEEASTGSSSESIELARAGEQIIREVNTNLSALYNNNDQVNINVTNQITILTEIINQPVVNVSDYAESLYDLISQIASISDSASSFVDTYQEFITSVTDREIESDSVGGGINTILSYELMTIAALAAICNTLLDADIPTQSETLIVTDKLLQLYYDIVYKLDSYQALYADTTIDFKYFSQQKTFPDVQKLVASTVNYLRSKSFDLATEKRFTIETLSSTARIVVEEYGEFGDDYENYDLFIESNSLTCDEVFELHPGREVVIYA